MKTFLIVLGVVVSLLFAGGCLATVSVLMVGLSESAKQAGSDSMDPTITDSLDDTEPRTVRVGKAFTIGEYRVLNGWKMTRDVFGHTNLNATVKNIGGYPEQFFFTVKFLRGKHVVVNLSCNTHEIEPGQTQSAWCWIDGTEQRSRVRFDRVTAESTF